MIVTPLLLVGAIAFAYTQWRSAQNARMAQILLSITERWDSPDMEASRCKGAECGNQLTAKIEEADTENSSDLGALVMVANFFDTIGVMIVEGLLDCKMGYKLFGRAAEYYYQLYRPLLEDARYEDYFKYFIDLHRLFAKEETAQLKPKRRFGF